MSLLRRGSEVVTVYPEVLTTDVDGNKVTKPSAVGMVTRAVIQPLSTDEKQENGFWSEERYRLRLVGYVGVLGAQSQIEWNGKRWSIDGPAKIYNGSPRTAHTDYTIRRA